MVSDNIGKIRKYQSIYLFVAKQSQGRVSLNLFYVNSLPGGSNTDPMPGRATRKTTS